MAEFIVELLVVVEADSFADAEALGERAATRAGKARRILNVIVSDVRDADDDGASGPGSERLA